MKKSRESLSPAVARTALERKLMDRIMQLEATVETMNEKVVSLILRNSSERSNAIEKRSLTAERRESRLLQDKRHSFERDLKNAAVFPKKLHRVGGNSCQTKRIYLRSGESGEIHNQNRI